MTRRLMAALMAAGILWLIPACDDHCGPHKQKCDHGGVVVVPQPGVPVVPGSTSPGGSSAPDEDEEEPNQAPAEEPEPEPVSPPVEDED